MKNIFIASVLGLTWIAVVLGGLGAASPVVVRARHQDRVQLMAAPARLPAAQGGTGFVRVALFGSDTSGCGSIVSPCRTVQFAVDQALPGETVIVSSGIWTESVTLSQPISLTGVSSATAIIRALPGQRVLTVTGAAIDHSVVISGLTFSGGDVSGGNICASGNPTNCGGGILLTNNARPFIQNVTIENNRALRGGGLYANETGALRLDRVIFRNNTVILAGGGLNAPNTPVTVTNSLFQENATTNNVGGALVTGANSGIVAPVFISNTTFLSNTAQCLGGLFSICDAPAVRLFDQDAQIINSRFEGNSCTDPDCDGGGLYLTASFNNPSLSVVNSDFINNTAGGKGGGVSVGNLAQMTLVNGRFENNRALSAKGGGLDHSNFLLAALATVSGTHFINNSAALDGGGLYSVSDLAISNASFESNSSGADGGGLLIDFGGDGSSLTNTSFLSNTAQSEGGGAFVFGSNLTVSDNSFSGNSAMADGGGLHACGVVTLTNLTIFTNTSHENGGGVYVGPREGIGGCGNGANEVVVSHSRFEANRSLDTPTFFSEGGGGLYVANTGSSLTLTNTDFIANRAESLGGGVHAQGGVIISGGDFQNNVATASNGGGVRAVGALTVDSAQFSGNVSGFAGGGAQAGGPAMVRNTLFQSNHAHNGGGLDVDDQVTVDNVLFLNNTAITSTGGGLNSFSALTVTNSLFQGNSSASSGGGLNGFNGQFVLSNTQFLTNTALNGGGLNYAFNPLNAVDVIIRGNTAISNGGGLATSSSATFSGNWEVSHNAAGEDGGGIWANSGLNGSGGRIEHNRSGGSGGGFYGGLAQILVNGTVFANNQAGGDGGGAYAFDGNAVEHVVFEDNTATGAGGGLFLRRFAHITATQFLGNAAGLGGGLAISRTNTGALVQFVTNSLFARNTAATNGAGFFYNQPRPIDLSHNTIASPALVGGAAIHIVTGTVTITNSIIASHTTGLEVVDGAVTENYTLFYGNAANTGGTVGGGLGRVTGNPAFQNPANDDYHLTATSAAINAGLDLGLSPDFEGDARPQQGEVDIGYDESPYPTPAPLLRLRKTSTNTNDGDLLPGEVLTYTLVVSNIGTAAATGAVVSDTAPINTNYQPGSISGGDGRHVALPALNWTINTLPLSTPVTLQFAVTVNNGVVSGTQIANTAVITSTEISTPTTDTTIDIVTELVPRLVISKSVIPLTNVPYRGTVTYTVLLSNSGDGEANSARLTDTLPAQVDFGRWLEQPAGAQVVSDTITWQGAITAGRALTFTFVASHTGRYSDVVTNRAVYALPPTSSGSGTAVFTVEVELAPPPQSVYLPLVVKE